MTREEAAEMMKAKLECMTREVSGTDQDCNAKKCDECDLCYEQGNMGEQKEWLRMGIKALESQKVGCWEENAPEWQNIDPPYICSECGNFHLQKTNYCDQCGAKMKGETE